MKRTLLKVLLVVSILVLILVPIFVLFTWGAGMVVGGIFAAMTNMVPSETSGPFAQFIGSPLFYVAVAAAATTLLSAAMLIRRKQ